MAGSFRTCITRELLCRHALFVLSIHPLCSVCSTSKRYNGGVNQLLQLACFCLKLESALLPQAQAKFLGKHSEGAPPADSS